MSAPGAVVIGGTVNGLGVVRALAARGIRTVVITTKPYDVAHRSRWISGHFAVSELQERPDALADLLERRASDWAGWALFPTNDEALAALREHGEGLSARYRLVAPTPEAIRYLLDKRLMMDAARAVGVDTPVSYGPAELGTLARDDLHFPVVVKPLATPRFFARFGSKLGVANDREELEAWTAEMGRAQVPGVVLDLVPGPDSDIYAYCAYLDRGGELIAGRLVRKLRQGPAGFGNARVAEVVGGDPGLQEATLEIARRIGLCGMVIAEFKRDSRDGRLRFFELNGRSVVYNALLRRAGLDLAALAWDDQVARGAVLHAGPVWHGVWIHLHDDLLYSALEGRKRRIGPAEFLAPYGRRMIDAVWSARDPMPFAAEWGRALKQGVSALRHRHTASMLSDRTRPPSRT
jgi:predicted ATP-grasp superfamily ATP-dependent carboligase